MRAKGKAGKAKKAAKPRAPRRTRSAAPRPPRQPEQRETGRQEEEPLEPEVLEPEPEAIAADAVAPADDHAEEAAPTTLPVPVDRDLARADALQRYMAEVARHPLLSREEEHELAVKFHQTRDPEIAYRLVTANLRLVVKIAHEYRRAAFNLLDLIQEGNIGLMHAVQKYDPFRGVKLSSYAAWWIRAYVYQYIMANSRMIKVATTFTQRKLFFNLNRECNRLERAGKEVEPKEIAARLGVSEKAVVEMSTRLNGREVQFDTTVAVDPPSADECLGGINVPQRPDEEVENRELQGAIRKKLDELVGSLETRERLIFEERLLAEKPITLRELGQRFGISRERARQLEERLKKRLRPVLQTMLGEGESDAARAA
jgi:RNA polymerase sigma-32 factor